MWARAHPRPHDRARLGVEVTPGGYSRSCDVHCHRRWIMRLKDAYIAAAAALAFAAPPLLADPAPSARTLGDVHKIRVDTAVCPAMIKDELSSRGFNVSFDGPADAVLDVQVANNGAAADDGSLRPAYSATLRGQNEQVL